MEGFRIVFVNFFMAGACNVMVVGLSHPDSLEHQLSSYEYSGAGFTSGIATRAIIQPLDVLKIRFQLQEEPLHRRSHGKYRGLLQSVSLIYREEGILAFWKGHVPAQGLSAVYGLVQFSVFEFLTRKSQEVPVLKKYDFLSDFICGAGAGCSATTCSMPMDVIRTRLVAQGNPVIYRGLVHAIFKIWRTEGMQGYFRGLVPSLLQIAPFAGLQFMSYNLINTLWNNVFKDHGTLYGSTGTVVSGFLAGTMAKTAVYPMDLIRHRFQVSALIRTGFGRTTSEKRIVKMVVGVIRRESFFGLFKGLGPSLVKTGANSALSFFFYELFCDLLRKI